ncbi:MAG: aldehyde dehydrogenase family protein, partial [Gemmatimonadetes bacterium]|nr:aldehyde dehydrogenase family protein [Gemmatimonadota bacterium]
MTRVREAFLNPGYGPAPESEALAMEWLGGGERAFGHYIGGSWTGGGDLHATRCPADGRLLARFAYGTAAEVDRAVRAAGDALAPWQETGGHERARHLYRLARQIQKRSRLFAVVESLDNGKTIREARDLDIPLAARHFYHHAGWAQLAVTEFSGYKPVGVVGQIIPWNFPLLMLAWKVAPALAAGNTVVLKPAEYTPLSALLFAEVAAETGLPPGVLNIVTGAGDTGAAVVRHPDVAKIAFTGSTEVGREIRRETAGTGKQLSLELGGKSPFVVFDTADIDAAVEGIVDGVWLNQGQVCCAGSRLLVQENVEDEMLARLRARMESIRVGHPLDKSMDMGAVVDQSQMDRIRGFLDAGEADGAEIWQPSGEVPRDGFFLPPTLCTGAPVSSPIVTEEVFGPVLVSLTFRTPAEAVALANDTRYGLAASVWTEDLSLAMDVAPAVKAGTVWVNCTNRFDAAAGFGGYRESGFGREGGKEGMWE